MTLTLDLRRDWTPEDCERRLVAQLQRRGKQQIGNALAGLVPPSLVPAVCLAAEVGRHSKSSQITKPERRRLAQAVKGLTLHVASARPIVEAIVTAGGVKLAEVEPRTMESRIVPGLFFAGEVLDLDGPSGGFNLQAAFSTGFLAGDSVADAQAVVL